MPGKLNLVLFRHSKCICKITVCYSQVYSDYVWYNQHSVSLLSVVVLLLVLGQNDQESDEDVDEIKEELKCVLHKILSSRTSLLNDKLGIKDDKSAEHQEAKVQQAVEEESGSQKDVEEAQNDHRGQSTAQHSTQEEVRSSFSKVSAGGEASENANSSKESLSNDCWVNCSNRKEQRTN